MSKYTSSDISVSAIESEALGADFELSSSCPDHYKNFDKGALLGVGGEVEGGIGEILARLERLEEENQLLKSIIKAIEPGLYQTLSDEGGKTDEAEKIRFQEAVKERNQALRSLFILYGNTLKALASKAEEGAKPGDVTRVQMAAIFDHLSRPGQNTPIYLPGIIDPKRGHGKGGKLTKNQYQPLVRVLRNDERPFCVGKVPFSGARYIDKKHRNGNFVWLEDRPALWRMAEYHFKINL